MFRQVGDTLEQAIDELDIPVDRDALVRCFKFHDKLTAKLAQAVGEYDASGVYQDDGSASMVQWLKRDADRSSSDASWLVARAHGQADAPSAGHR